MIDIFPLWISLKTALLATLITFFAGLAAAYWMLGYRGKWRFLIEGILISPLILPPTVVGFLLLLLFGKNGLLGKILAVLNINIVFTWYGAAIAACIVAFPLMYKTTLGAFEQIDGNLLGVARILGATESAVFWRITFPLALPGIIAGTTLAFARALGEFGATLMLAGNIPGQTQTIPMAIYFAVEGGDINEAWFWSAIILTISLAGVTAVNFWQEVREKGRGMEVSNVAKEILIHNSPTQFLPNSGLFVDIKKQLPGFLLKVCFSTNDQPLGLLGASGAGKSMILRCIAGIETPSSGRIVLNGRVLFDSNLKINLPARDRDIGFLFQNYALFPHLTVASNIAFGSKRKNTTNRALIEAQLAAVQLQGLSNRYPHQLSGGQQQRVALARALFSQPEALLLDEPFSALDTHLRSQMEQQLISSLATYPGVSLFVTHNLEEAYRVCEDLLVMDRGQVKAYGKKHDVFERPTTKLVAELTGCKNFSRAMVKGENLVEAIDWQCTLQVIAPIPDLISYIGIRAHQLVFTDSPNENTFSCWLAKKSETPHRMTLYLKLNSFPTSEQDYHLQAEVFKEKWAIIKDHPLPWYIRLDPLRLILMQD